MSAPTAATPVLKVVSIDDLGIKIVELPAGTFLVDGEIVTHGGWNSYNTKHQISVKDIENVRAINSSSILTGYLSDSGETISFAEYQEKLEAICKNATVYDDEFEWPTLEDEFAYRKFMQTWKAQYKTETSYSEPLLIDRTHILQDTGNPYIKAGFLTGEANTPLYSYSRTNAVADLMAKKFESLGMEHKEKLTYGQTEGKKVWSNSDHSGLEYVTAFGRYIMGKPNLPKTRGEFKGSLEYLTKIYEEDKKWIEDLIQVGYNLHFRNEGASSVLIKEIWDGLKTCIAYVNTMDVKVKSETSKRSALNQLNKMLDNVNQEILK